jgi:hypothetical protein
MPAAPGSSKAHTPASSSSLLLSFSPNSDISAPTTPPLPLSPAIFSVHSTRGAVITIQVTPTQKPGKRRAKRRGAATADRRLRGKPYSSLEGAGPLQRNTLSGVCRGSGSHRPAHAELAGREDRILARASASSCFRNALTPMIRDPLATQHSMARLNTWDLQRNGRTEANRQAGGQGLP